jgi:integrase
MPIRAKDAKLFFDFLWCGVRCKEYTGLADTPDNRRCCEQKMLPVRRAISRKTFDYRQHFPRGSRLHLFSRMGLSNEIQCCELQIDG